MIAVISYLDFSNSRLKRLCKDSDIVLYFPLPLIQSLYLLILA